MTFHDANLVPYLSLFEVVQLVSQPRDVGRSDISELRVQLPFSFDELNILASATGSLPDHDFLAPGAVWYRSERADEAALIAKWRRWLDQHLVGTSNHDGPDEVGQQFLDALEALASK